MTRANSQIKIFYAGLDVMTLNLLLSEASFSIVGVGCIDNFNVRSLNPVNSLFKYIYFLRRTKSKRLLEVILRSAWRVMSVFSTSVFRKYAHYLEIISRHKIEVIDLDGLEAPEQLKMKKVDVMVVNVWGIIGEDVLSAPHLGAFNVHPSRLPQYRGALPTLWSLKNNDRQSAVSYITLTKKADAGNIISQYIFDIEEDDNWLSLERKVAEIARKTLVVDLKKFVNGELSARFQDEMLASTTGRYDAYRKIDLMKEKSSDICNKICLYPWVDPGTYCYFYFSGMKIELKHATLAGNRAGLVAGQFVVSYGRVFLQAKDATLRCRLFFDVGFVDSLKFLHFESGYCDA